MAYSSLQHPTVMSLQGLTIAHLPRHRISHTPGVGLQRLDNSTLLFSRNTTVGNLPAARTPILGIRSSLDRPFKPDQQQAGLRRTRKPKTSLEQSSSDTEPASSSSSSSSSPSSCHATESRSLAAFSVTSIEDTSSLPPANVCEEVQSNGQGGGSVLGAIALITGTSVGAGILALPLETASAGFIPSASLLVGCWAFLTVEAFLIADVNIGLLNKRRSQGTSVAESSGSDVISLRTMADETLGPVGGLLSTATYIFLSYTLVVAYVAKAADVATMNTDIPYDVAAAAFAASLGGLVYAGNTQTTDIVNRVMTGGLLSLFFLIVFGGSLNADWSQLGHQDWSQATGTLPVVFLSLVFHDLIPVLCTYLDGDIKKVRTAIAVGGAVPLAMFLLWDAVALALSGGVSGVDPLEVLMSLGGATQGAVVEGFSILAIMTSFIGTALSFSEFFIEQLNCVIPRRGGREQSLNSSDLNKVTPQGDEQQLGQEGSLQPSFGANLSRQQVLRAAAFSLVLVPSVAIACSTPDAFFAASEAAGAYGMTVLYGIFPPLMFWKARQQAKQARASSTGESRDQKSTREWWDRPAGVAALASMAACAFSVIVSQAALDTASFRSEGPAISPSIGASPVAVLASTTPVANALQSENQGAAGMQRRYIEKQTLESPHIFVEEDAAARSA